MDVALVVVVVFVSVVEGIVLAVVVHVVDEVNVAAAVVVVGRDQFVVVVVAVVDPAVVKLAVFVVGEIEQFVVVAMIVMFVFDVGPAVEADHVAVVFVVSGDAFVVVQTVVVKKVAVG